MSGRLLVIGGGAAGMSAASAARRVDPHLEIVVVEATSDAAWGLCGLPYYVQGVVPAAEDLVAYPTSTFRDKRRIDLRLNMRATAVDLAGRTVSVTRDGTVTEMAYDRLIVTAGASPVRPPWAAGDRVFEVRGLDDARRMRALLDSGGLRRALVVGAGYIGLEMADALRARGCDVVVVELLEQVLPNLDRELASRVEDEVRRHVDLRLGTALTAIEGGERLRVTVGDETMDVDTVVSAVGARPTTSLIAGAATATPSGALLVDDHMRTSIPDVYAAGDCIAVTHLVTGQPVFVPLGPTANKTGRVAGTVAAGGKAHFSGIVGTAVVKVFDLTVARTGLTATDAEREGFRSRVTDIVHRSRAKYYPGSEDVAVRVVADVDGRLLGAQMVSADPLTAKRIDVFATALQARMGVADVATLDLSYAPPYAPVYDPVIQAALVAERKLARERAVVT